LRAATALPLPVITQDSTPRIYRSCAYNTLSRSCYVGALPLNYADAFLSARHALYTYRYRLIKNTHARLLHGLTAPTSNSSSLSWPPACCSLEAGASCAPRTHYSAALHSLFYAHHGLRHCTSKTEDGEGDIPPAFPNTYRPYSRPTTATYLGKCRLPTMPTSDIIPATAHTCLQSEGEEQATLRVIVPDYYLPTRLAPCHLPPCQQCGYSDLAFQPLYHVHCMDCPVRFNTSLLLYTPRAACTRCAIADNAPRRNALARACTRAHTQATHRMRSLARLCDGRTRRRASLRASSARCLLYACLMHIYTLLRYGRSTTRKRLSCLRAPRARTRGGGRTSGDNTVFFFYQPTGNPAYQPAQQLWRQRTVKAAAAGHGRRMNEGEAKDGEKSNDLLLHGVGGDYRTRTAARWRGTGRRRYRPRTAYSENLTPTPNHTTIPTPSCCLLYAASLPATTSIPPPVAAIASPRRTSRRYYI